MQQHVRFVFLVQQFRSSLSDNVLQIVSVLLHLLNHGVHYVKLPTMFDSPKLLLIAKSNFEKVFLVYLGLRFP